MRRRDFIVGFALTGAWSLAARAQQPPMPLIGFMSGRSLKDSEHLVAAFREGLGEAGFVESQNVGIEFRWADGQYDRLPAIAAELVSRRVAILSGPEGDLVDRLQDLGFPPPCYPNYGAPDCCPGRSTSC